MRIGTFLSRVSARMRAFSEATRGNVAMIFGLALIPICLGAGVGLDMSRAMITRARMGTALDAAGLAIGSHPGMSLDDMNKLANLYFQQNYTADKASYGTPAAVSVVRDGQKIELTTNVEMPTTLMGLVNVDTMKVAAKSEVTWGQTKLWVALVLDNTGSMSETDADGNKKIDSLKDATHNVLNILQSAASEDGDVQVSIVPFSKAVKIGTSHVNDTWLTWTDWELAPPSSMPGTDIGPGSPCPYGKTVSPYGYGCTSGPANGASAVTVIPTVSAPTWSSATTYAKGDVVNYNGSYYTSSKSSNLNKSPATNGTYWAVKTVNYVGYICPGQDSGKYNAGRPSHYWNGCYNSVGTKTKQTTCTQVVNSSGNQTSYNCSSATVTAYNGLPTTTCTSTTGSGRNPSTTNTCVNQPGAPYTHTWISNAHSTWTGCIEDRAQDYDIGVGTPSGASSNFPPENTTACPGSALTTLGYSWSDLSTQVTNMSVGGSTNQTIGLALGWQTLTDGLPWSPPAFPVGGKKFIVLLSDGMNTQDRWSGDGSNEDTGTDGRMTAACTALKDDPDITIYTVFVKFAGTSGNGTILKNCASDGKYYEVTTGDEIKAAMNQIALQITDLRLSL